MEVISKNCLHTIRGKSFGSILHSSCLVSKANRKSLTASSLKGAALRFGIYCESLDTICSSLRVASTLLWTAEQSGIFDISIVWTWLGCANTACEPASTKVKSLSFIMEKSVRSGQGVLRKYAILKRSYILNFGHLLYQMDGLFDWKYFINSISFWLTSLLVASSDCHKISLLMVKFNLSSSVKSTSNILLFTLQK